MTCLSQCAPSNPGKKNPNLHRRLGFSSFVEADHRFHIGHCCPCHRWVSYPGWQTFVLKAVLDASGKLELKRSIVNDDFPRRDALRKAMSADAPFQPAQLSG